MQNTVTVIPIEWLIYIDTHGTPEQIAALTLLLIELERARVAQQPANRRYIDEAILLAFFNGTLGSG